MVLLVDTVTNLRITDSEALPSPADLCGDIARTTQQKMLVAKSRNEMHSLIHGQDKRLLAVVGPCSIHDLKACREYAERFAKLAEELSDRLLMVMRLFRKTAHSRVEGFDHGSEASTEPATFPKACASPVVSWGSARLGNSDRNRIA